MIGETHFREQYVIIYNSFNIIKNLLLCVALIIKQNNNFIGRETNQVNYPFDNFHPFNNQN